MENKKIEIRKSCNTSRRNKNTISMNINMMKTLFLGILLFGVVNTAELFAQKPPYGLALDKSKKEFLDRTEINILFWIDYYRDIKNKYGDTSLEAKQVLPDTALFRQVYGFSFYSIHPAFYNSPMTCISYEQALNYCQWRTEKVNELLEIKKKSYRVAYSLPSKEDFEKALSKAIISQSQPLHHITGKKNKFTGITDNVPEYTNVKNIIVSGGDANKIETSYRDTDKIETTAIPLILVGFRCKSIIINK
jgi:hypothetical protein